MDDQGNPKSLFINLEKLENYLSEKGVTNTCQSCGNDKWIVPNSSMVAGGVLPWGTGTGDVYPMGLPVVIMFCSNCKLVKSHALVDGMEEVLEERDGAPSIG
ncbi:MAG: hypothetical protein ACRC07_11255 [Pseudomonas paracarnis]